MKTITEVFEDHLAKRLAGKVEEDIRENYATDIVLMTGTGTLEGHEGVRQSAKELSQHLKEAKFNYRHTLVKEPYAFLEWTAQSESREIADGADSFVIKNGKIVFQSVHYTVTKK